MIDPHLANSKIRSGSANGLYNADALSAGRPAMLVEGELDALTIRQETGDLVATVATGATGGARRMHWIARLALCSAVLVAYDADTPGNTAAAFWLETLDNARRWRPYWEDANAMAQAGADVRAWVAAGVGELTLEDKRRGLEAQMEWRLDVLAAATGCDDAEAERLLAHWEALNEEYTANAIKIRELSRT